MFRQRQSIACFLALWLAFVTTAAGAATLPPSGEVNGLRGHILLRELGEQLLVLDVRTPAEFARGHVPGALHIPVQELEKRLGEIPGDRPILLVCRTGRRAVIAYNILTRARPEMIRSGLWRLRATSVYRPDGSFAFR